MKKLKLLFASLALLVGSGANAQVYIETDLTSQFNSLATTKWDGSSGQVGWAAPQVTTNSGLTVAAWESYCGDWNGGCTNTGTIMKTTVTGLVPGTYKIELYGAAAFTFDRNFGSDAFTGDITVGSGSKSKSDTYTEGQSITENTGVFLYATTSEGTYNNEIPIWYATNFNGSGLSTAVLNGVVVGENGNVEIGMSKTSKSTNWHVVQLKGVTATVDAVATFATFKAEAEGLYSSPMNATVLSELQAAANVDLSSAGADEYKTAIETLQAKITAAKTSVANYAAAKVYLDKDASLDAAGQASYDANETVAAVQTAYDARTLETLADEQKTAMDAAIIVAIKSQTTAGSDWTQALVNPSFENDWTGWNQWGMARQGNKAFGGVDGNIYVEKWQPDGSTFYAKQTVTLPAGVYQVSAKTLARAVASAKIYAAGVEATIPVADQVNNSVVEFACDENAEVEFGFEGVGKGTGSSWLCVDDFHLTLVSKGLPDVTAVTGKMNADIATAQATAVDTYNGNRTVANYNAAQAAIANAQASKDAYAGAHAAIEKANALKEAHNFATAAATETFTNAIKAISDKYDDGTLTQEEAAAAGTTLGTANTGVRTNPTGAAVVYMNNGFGLNAYDAALQVNTWSVEGANDGTNFVVPFYEYWTGDDNSLNNKTWTGTLTELPNGHYTVSAWVRVRAKNGTAATDATGITMDVNGGGEGDYAAVDVTEGTQVGASQFTIGTFTAQGLVKQGELTLNFNIADANINWLSIKNIKYTKTRDLTPEEAFIAATADDYNALNAAIAAHTIGFEDGEYAPYNNAAGIAAVAAAQAIDQTATNSQGDVQAATTAITGATWTANDGEVNAIWDGSFEYNYRATTPSGNINPYGWQRVKNAAADGYNVRYQDGTNAGLQATSSGKALFTKQSAYYGYADGYAMPLKANTYYKITFIYGGWGDCKKDGYVSMAAPDGSAVTLSATDLPLDATNADSNVGSWKNYEAIFQTGEAGNYVLGLRKKSYDTSGQSQYVYGDIVLVKATAADFKDALLAEITTASAVDVTANVGDGVFQKPAADATTLTTAISDAQTVYDNAAATISEVLTATESVKTAVETYNNVELNAPDAAKRYAVTMHDAGKDWDGNAITFIAGGRSGEGNYNVKYEAPANVNLAQALKFTSVAGKSNTFYVSVVNANGDEQYLTSKTLAYGDGTVNDQIRTIDDVTKAVEISVKVADGVDGFKLFNQTGTEIARNSSSPDNGLFPNGNVDSYFTIAETTKPSITINTTAAGYGTTILPFAQALPTDVKAYSCAAVDGNTLTLVEVDGLEANKPYLIEGAWNETVTGDALGTALTNTVGLFTGVYAAQTAPVGSFVLQKNNDKVGFYKVQDGEDNQPTVNANRIYMTVPAGARFDAFFFDSETTGINAINALTSGEAEIYNLKGEKIDRLQKGMNIIKMNGKIQKVMVK